MTIDIREYLKARCYPGRGIICAVSRCGKFAVLVYFLMGRSKNSRNRILSYTGQDVRTDIFSKKDAEDTSLIIYNPVRHYKNYIIAGNGSHTDIILEGLARGESFSKALQGESYEPDHPINTPRISALLDLNLKGCRFTLSIIKADEKLNTNRLYYEYSNMDPGRGRLIHTYEEAEGANIPCFIGKPRDVEIFSDDINMLSESIWESLDFENRVALYCEKTDLVSKKRQSLIINRLKA